MPEDFEYSNMEIIMSHPTHVKMTGRPPSKRNRFFESTLRALGGSEIAAITKYKQLGRFGGGGIDSLLYLKNYDYKPSLVFDPTLSPIAMCKEIFGKVRSIQIGDIFQCMLEPDIPGDTSPGVTYRRLGFSKKAEALPICIKFLMSQYKDICQGAKFEHPLLWLVSGRPKLTDEIKANEKVYARKGVGRAVWVPDLEESVLSRHFTKSITKEYTGMPQHHKIMIGFDKCADHKEFQTWIKKFDCYICLDYSKFDASVQTSIIKYAFSVLECLYSNMNEVTNKYWNYLQDNFINSIIDVGDGRLVKKNTGIPSGSGFTSIIGSVCNYVMLYETFKALKWPDSCWDAKVYGDDCLIGINYNTSAGYSAFKLFKLLKKTIESKFQVKISNSDSKLVAEKFVKVCEPIYEGDTSRGTSNMKPVRVVYHDLEPTTGVYALSSSHRWHYSFQNTWEFLGYSMLPSGHLIRKTFDVFSRIFNPENAVKTWDDHITMLKMALIENYDNAHTRNRVYHYLYDAWWNLKHGISQRNIVGEGFEEQTGRCWYRRVMGWVNLIASPLMQTFNDYWLDLEKKIIIMRQRLSIDERYFKYVRKLRLSHAVFDYDYRPKYYNELVRSFTSIGFALPDKVKMYAMGMSVVEKFKINSNVIRFLYDRIPTDYDQYNSEFLPSILSMSAHTKLLHANLFPVVEKKISNIDILKFIW